MALPETKYLSRIHLSPPREAQARSAADYHRHFEQMALPETTSDLVHAPRIDVPLRWRRELPHHQFVTILPFQEAANFRDLCQSASIIPRSFDDNADVIGVYRGKGLQPVWMTGILSHDRKWASGLLDFGGKHRRENGRPNIGFNILYGHPDTMGFKWDDLYETLEEQFAQTAYKPDLLKKLIRAWEPRLKPLADTMQSLEEAAFAVVLTGENRYRGSLADLGISRYPLITPAFKKFISAVWSDIPYEVGVSGWFVPEPSPVDMQTTD